MISVPSGSVHKTLDAVFQMDNVEVYKQSDGFTTELEIRKHLRAVNGGNRIDRLQFDYNQVFDEQIVPGTRFEFDAIVNDGKRDLGIAFETGLLQFMLQAGWVRALQQTRP